MKNDKKLIDRFNVRVYGIIIQKNKIMLVKENLNGFEFTKFPGGGLEYGEGLIDGLKREIKEELNLSIKIIKHFYTTDFFQRSKFFKNEQIISVYFLIKIIDNIKNITFPYETFQGEKHKLTFFWLELENLNNNKFTFPIDKKVAKMIIKQTRNNKN